MIDRDECERYCDRFAELTAEMEGWKEEAGDAEELRTQLTALADAAELVMRSDYTGYTHRMLEQALRAIGRGPYAPYGDASADMSPEAAQLKELREAAEAAYDWAEKHGEETCTAFERLEAVLAKLKP